MVLIFSRPCISASLSNSEKMLFKNPTSSFGASRPARGVKSTMSANEDGHRVELVGDDLVRVLLKSRRDRGRHEVEKQVLGTIILAFQFALAASAMRSAT